MLKGDRLDTETELIWNSGEESTKGRIHTTNTVSSRNESNEYVKSHIVPIISDGSVFGGGGIVRGGGFSFWNGGNVFLVSDF